MLYSKKQLESGLVSLAAILCGLALVSVVPPVAAQSSTDCVEPEIEDEQDQTTDGHGADVHATVDTSTDTKSDVTKKEGMYWTVEELSGANRSFGSYSVTPGKYNIQANLYQELETDGTKTVTADGDIDLPVVLTGLATETVDVRVTIMRFVEPASGTTGTVTFNDSGSGSATVVDLSNGSYKHTVSYLETSLAGNATVPLIDFRTEVSMGTATGSVVVQTAVEIEVEGEGTGEPCGEDEDDSEECEGGDCDDGGGNEPSDKNPPTGPDCPEGEDGPGSDGNDGDALHIDLATGRIYTTVPILTTYANGGREIDLKASYNTVNHETETVLGYGWRHNYDFTLKAVYSYQHLLQGPNEKVFELDHILYTDGNGRQHLYQGSQSATLRTDAATDDIVHFSSFTLSPPRGRNMKVSGSWDSVSGTPKFSVDYEDGRSLNFVSDVTNLSGSHTITTQSDSLVDRRGRILRFVWDSTGHGATELRYLISPHGRVVEFDYNSDNRIATITHPDTNDTTTIAYNTTHGRLLSFTDPDAKVQSFAYEASGSSWLLDHETLKNGSVYSVDYNIGVSGQADYVELLLDGTRVGKLVETGTANLHWDRTTSKDDGRLTYYDGKAQPWQIDRDFLGRIVRKTSPNGQQQNWSYGGRNAGNNRNRMIEATDQNGNPRTQTWTAEGRLATFKDAENNTTTYTYGNTELPEKMTKKTLPGSVEWNYVYDDSTNGLTGATGDLLQIKDPDNETIDLVYTNHGDSYDVPFAVTNIVSGATLPGRISIVERTDRRDNVTRYEYDGRGDLVKVIRDYGGMNLTTEYDHDPYGRVTERKIKDGAFGDKVTNYEHDGMGRLTDIKRGPSSGTQLVTEYVYDGHGLLTMIIDGEGNEKKYEYDDRNRLEKTRVDPDGLDLTTEYIYDANDNVIHRRDPKYFDASTGYTTDYGYNEQNFLIQIVAPEDSDGTRHTTDIWRDGVGNVIGVVRTNAHGASNDEDYVLKQKFDALNRITERVVDPAIEEGYPGSSGGLDLTTTIEYTPNGGCTCSGPIAGSGMPRKIVDPEDRVTYIRYDDLNRREAIVRKVGTDNGDTADSDDAETKFHYDAEGNLMKVEGPVGERVDLFYDEANRRDKIHAYYDGTNYLITTISYTAADVVSSTVTAAGNEIKLTYDTYNRLITAEDRVSGSSSAYDLIAEYTYFDNGYVESRSTGVFESTTQQTWTYEYDAANRLKKIYDPIVETSTDLYTNIEYDANSNRVFVRDREGIYTKYVYDELNRLIKKVANFSGTGTELTNDGGNDATADTETEYLYNSLRQIAILDNEANQTDYEYDAALRLIEVTYPSGGSDYVTYTYHDDGLLNTRVDQRNITTTYTYDDLGYLSARSFNDTSPATPDDTFDFDKSGRLIAADNSVATLDFSYDLLGRLTSTTQSYVGETDATYVTDITHSVTADDVLRQIQYPGDGLSVNPGDADGRTIDEQRDRRGRLVGVTEAITSNELYGVSFQYDEGNRRTGGYMGHNWDWSTSAWTPDSTTDLISSLIDYDLNNRLTNIQHANDVDDFFDVDYGYDIEGNRLYSDDQVRTDRDELYDYDERYRLVSMQRGTYSSGSITETEDGTLPRAQEWPVGATTGLDSRGNWATFVDTTYDPDFDDGNGTIGAEFSMTHDREHTDSNEIESFRKTHSAANIIGGFEVSYDAAGNLTHMDAYGDMNCDGAVTSGDIGAFTLAATDQAGYEALYPNCLYQLGDFNGNGVVSGADSAHFTAAIVNGAASREFTYDAENRLTSATIGGQLRLEIEYDAMGRRVIMTDYEPTHSPCSPVDDNDVVVTRHIYLGLNTIEEYESATCDDSGASDVDWYLAREFLWGDRFPEPLALIDHTDAGEETASTEEWMYYLRDVLGNVVGLVTPEDQDTTGQQSEMLERYTYDPYGTTYVERWNSTANEWEFVDESDFGNPFMWTGQRHDETIAMYHFPRRNYLPELGRWMQRDPLGLLPDINYYNYVRATPLRFSDPLGLEPNKGEVANPSDLVDLVDTMISNGDSPHEVFSNIAEAAGDGSILVGRYFYTEDYGWVDARHFFAAVNATEDFGAGPAQLAGLLVELVQAVTLDSSGFSYEDIPSNLAGTDFAQTIPEAFLESGGVAAALRDWLNGAGAKPFDNPGTGFDDLPDSPFSTGPILTPSNLKNLLENVLDWFTTPTSSSPDDEINDMSNENENGEPCPPSDDTNDRGNDNASGG